MRENHKRTSIFQGNLGAGLLVRGVIALALMLSVNVVAASSGERYAAGEAPTSHGAHGHHSRASFDFGRPDGHAPIGVMGDHTHHRGEWMFSYRFMFMDMDGNRDGSDRLSPAQVLSRGYMVAPIRMLMRSHMFGAMYAVNDRVTLAAMLPYRQISMEHVTGSGLRFSTRTEGVGDLKLNSLWVLCQCDGQQWQLNLGASIPTGSIDERGDTPAMSNAPLPYPMQLGSGTFDLMPGVTWLKQGAQHSWGAQFIATIRLGDNDRGYSLGNRGDLSAWFARAWSDAFSSSLRLRGQVWDNIAGRDDRVNPMMVPTADAERRAGRRIDALAGANWHARGGLFDGHRLAIEAGVPVYQVLDGPQLGTDLTVTVGWQRAF